MADSVSTSNGVSGSVDVDSINDFMAVTGAGEQQARFCIEACGGNVDRAVQMFYNDSGLGMPASPPLHDPYNFNADLQQNHQAQQEPNAHAGGGGRRGGGLLNGAGALIGQLAFLPISVLRTSLGLLGSVLSYGLGAASFIFPQGLRDAYHRANGENDPIRQAREFIRTFENSYGSEHPEFVEMGWREAAAQAHRECKFLWVYVHAPDHENTEAFCRDVLCSPEVTNFLTSNFVCWGGDIRQGQAFTLATSVGVTTFPFMCLLAYSGSRTEMVSSIQGRLNSSDFIGVLRQVMDEQGARMVSERVEREQMEMDRKLREEQDAAYMAGLEADRAREKQKLEEQRAREEKEREKKRLEEQERLKREAERRRKEEHESAVEARRQQKRASLKPEPNSGEGVSQIRVRLPDGSTFNRRFLHTDKVQDVYDYVDSLDNLKCLDYTLVCFPRAMLGPDKLSFNLTQVGLVPSGAVLVQSNDD